MDVVMDTIAMDTMATDTTIEMLIKEILKTMVTAIIHLRRIDTMIMD